MSKGQVDKKLGIIERWYDIQENLAQYYTQKYGYEIKREAIFTALFIRVADKFALEWPGDMWDVEMDFNDTLQSISDFNFHDLSQNIIVDNSIFPDRLLMSYKAKVKSKGLIWIIHRYDKDPFPSNPHAHQLENNIKLDLSNGKCYKVREHVYTIDKKSLLLIRKETEKVFKGELPELKI